MEQRKSNLWIQRRIHLIFWPHGIAKRQCVGETHGEKVETHFNTKSKSIVLVDTDPEDLQNDDKEQKHFKKVKRSDSTKEKASKSPEFF